MVGILSTIFLYKCTVQLTNSIAAWNNLRYIPIRRCHNITKVLYQKQIFRPSLQKIKNRSSLKIPILLAIKSESEHTFFP